MPVFESGEVLRPQGRIDRLIFARLRQLRIRPARLLLLYIVLTQPQRRFFEAFLGPRYKPFATGGDPRQQRFAVEGVMAPGISDQRQRKRRDLLRRLDTLGHAMAGDPQLEALNKGW